MAATAAEGVWRGTKPADEHFNMHALCGDRQGAQMNVKLV